MKPNERYSRQILLPGFGEQAQDKLSKAKILIVGMGGLGCPVLQYLVGAGIGTIGIIDPDEINTTNLHRQVLFSENETGQKKVTIAAQKMKQLNAEVRISAYPVSLDYQNALALIQQYDLVVDATDNFQAKYIINDACVILGKPFVYGAVSRYEGQLSVFNLPDNGQRPIQYRDLFPVMPLPGEIASCEQAGVLGVLPGIIGTLQAAEVIKLVTGLGKPLYGRLYNYDLLQSRGYEINLYRKELLRPVTREEFERLQPQSACFHPDDIPEITVDEFNQLRKQPDVLIMDVRDRHEYPQIDFSDVRIPMSELPGSIAGLPDKEICVICHQGIRSVYAAQMIREQRNLKVYSLKGGLTAYFKHQNQ